MIDDIVCISTNCLRYTECERTIGTGCAINCAYYGSGSLSSDGTSIETWWCGELGHYAMFIPKEE